MLPRLNGDFAGVAGRAGVRHSYRYPMSTVLHPQGPHRPNVYWRRRAVVLLALIAVLLVIGLLLFGGGGGNDQADASPEPSASPSPEAASPSPDPEASASDAPSSAASPEPAAAPACSDSDIQVAVSSDQETYPPGQNPQLTLTIRNAAGQDCVRDIGSGANEIVITSGGYHVWSSDDCDPSQASNDEVLPPDAEAAVTLTWERKLSAAGCSGDGSAAQAGTYQVEGRNGQVVSEPIRIVVQ